jgi:hypothetical protein
MVVTSREKKQMIRSQSDTFQKVIYDDRQSFFPAKQALKKKTFLRVKNAHVNALRNCSFEKS